MIATAAEINAMAYSLPTNWPWVAECRPSWIAYDHGDRDPQVKERATRYQQWLDMRGRA